jgi:hypothetical protein
MHDWLARYESDGLEGLGNRWPRITKTASLAATASSMGLEVISETVTIDPSYRTGMEALTSSLDRIQHAASKILRAIEAGG